MKRHFRFFYTAIAWTFMIQVLLCLPGSSIPSPESFGIPNLDKLAHVIIFGTLVYLWCVYLNSRATRNKTRSIGFFLIFLAACANGIIIEYVQKYYIPNRSFDQGDIIADILSAGITYGLCNVKFIT